MPNKYAETFFTQSAQELQKKHNSHHVYGPQLTGPDTNNVLTMAEKAFIEARDSFYMATITEDGWPYVQHRGGPVGFTRVLSATQLGFADFSGNFQFITAANVTRNPRVSLIFMDYVNRRRLKIAGLVTVINHEHESLKQLDTGTYRAVIDRGFLIDVVAFDWNCPQHITQRFDKPTVDKAIAPLLDTIEALENNKKD
jgi:predicted pyridoxine 5'-phosphate oxidase superfamily flavin-nucleotide-binding protein